MSVTHKYTIICDDVRREDNGKLIVLGMYLGTITVPQLPAILPSLTIVSLFQGERPESWSWRLSIQNMERNNQVVVEARGFANVLAPGPGVMPVKFVGVQFQQAGAYNVVLEVEGQREPLSIDPLTLMLTPQVFPGQQAPMPGQPGFPTR